MQLANRSQNRGRGLLVGLGGLVALALGVVWWFSFAQPTVEPARLTVAATIFPLTDIVQQVAGDEVRVVPLVSPGASPHAASLTPQQLANVQQAEALFMIGHGLDEWAATAVAQAAAVPSVVVDGGITLRTFGAAHAEEDDDDHGADAIDPHYWLTVPNAQHIARTVAATLAEIDPDHAAEYQRNLDIYLAELAELEMELQQAARGVAQKDFIAIHDGWSYFADHYGFALVATYEPVEGQQPSLADLQHLRDVVTEHGITVFYTEPQKQSSAAVRVFRDEFGLMIRVLDPIGGVPPRDSYPALMRENMRTLGGRT